MQYCKNNHELHIQRRLKNKKSYARCDRCNKKIVIDEKNDSYLGCEECIYDLCRRCSPVMIEKEIEDEFLGEEFRKHEEQKDLIFFETQH